MAKVKTVKILKNKIKRNAKIVEKKKISYKNFSSISAKVKTVKILSKRKIGEKKNQLQHHSKTLVQSVQK